MALHLNNQNVKHTRATVASHHKPSQWSEFLSVTRSIAIFLAIAFMLRASVVEAFKIPSSSMEPTLEIGDHILVNKLSYGFRLPFVDNTIWQYRSPRRGDVVVFTLPDNPETPEIDESQTNIIKRVIGLPGDNIMVRGMSVYIDGKIYQDDNRHARWLQGGKRDFGAVTVPEGRVLVLGDNRDYSKDSRYWPNPFLEISRIKGRAFVIYWNSSLFLSRMFNIVD